jgi:hypothetical protein
LARSVRSSYAPIPSSVPNGPEPQTVAIMNIDPSENLRHGYFESILTITS